jgi:hypothetical protein
MSAVRFFLDTSFVVGLLNPRDELHATARQWFPRLREAAEVWVTEAVLTEVGNGLARVDRQRAALFLRQCYREGSFRVASVDTPLMRRALELYGNRSDKDWGMTDCISFLVMEEQGLTDVLSADEHFVQAGFRALLLEGAPG